MDQAFVAEVPSSEVHTAFLLGLPHMYAYSRLNGSQGTTTCKTRGKIPFVRCLSNPVDPRPNMVRTRFDGMKRGCRYRINCVASRGNE